MKTQIIDNALDSKYFEKIQEALMSNEFPWFWTDKIEDEKYDTDRYYLTNQFYYHFQTHRHEKSEEDYKANQKDAVERSTIKYWHLEPLISLLNPSDLVRVKANLYLRTDEIVHHDNHIDYEFEHTAAILYVNTNDGLTILEDGTECESIANRLLLFDATKPHHSTTCTDQKRRVNINVNFIE